VSNDKIRLLAPSRVSTKLPLFEIISPQVIHLIEPLPRFVLELEKVPLLLRAEAFFILESSEISSAAVTAPAVVCLASIESIIKYERCSHGKDQCRVNPTSLAQQIPIYATAGDLVIKSI